VASLALLFTAAGSATSSAADDEAWAVFDGKKDRVVEIRPSSGRVVVTGTNSDTVYVRARRIDVQEADEEPEADDPRAAGLRKITHGATGLETWGDGNVVTVATRNFGGSVELYVRVPRNATLEISAHFADSVFVRNMKAPVNIGTNGSVRLENVDGEIEVETGGWIYLTDVAGSVVCNSGFGGIEGNVKRVRADQPVSLSAIGPIDVTIPRDSKATLYMKTSFGEVYTDFDMKIQRGKDWPDDAEGRIPLVTMLPPRPLKVPRPVVVVEPKPEKPDKPEESEEAEKESKSREEYDATVKAYLRVQREQWRAQREITATNRALERAYVDVAVIPFLAPTLSPGMIGEINGGGVDIRLTSMSGSIYVRRGK
jgi:hypothetical protein